MLSRYEYLYTKQKLKKLSDKLFDFKNGRRWDERTKKFIIDETYKEYLNYDSLFEIDKIELEKSWAEYYKKCSESVYGKIFWSMKQLYIIGDIKTIQELAKKVLITVGIKPIPKPSSIDPNELMMKMQKFFNLEYDCKVLEELVEEYSQIYEKKPEQMGL